MCDACSPHRVVLQQSAEKGKVRVCDQCVQAHDAQGEAAIQAVITTDSPATHARSMSSSSHSGGDRAVPMACVLPPPATVVPVAAAVVSPTAVAVASPVAAPASPAPVAVAPRAAVVPVQALAPRLVPPTAAPISSPPAAAAASSSSGGGLFGSLARLQSKMETVAARHAPGLVTAIREQVAAATMKEEQERVEKAKNAEKLIALANATEQPLPPAAAAAASAASASAPVPAGESVAASVSVAPAVASPPGTHIAHIPGLGPVALAVSPPSSDEQRAAREGAWSNLPKKEHERKPSGSLAASASDSALLSGFADDASEPASASAGESELRRRKGAPSASGASDGAKSSAPPSWEASPAKAAGAGAVTVTSPVPLSSSSSSSSASAAAAAAAASASAAAAASGNLKLDLPLRLCLVILKKTAAEMRERFVPCRHHARVQNARYTV